jgi:hypothetical protein
MFVGNAIYFIVFIVSWEIYDDGNVVWLEPNYV